MKKISPQQMRRCIIEQSKRANAGHIGSSLSIVELLAAIYNLANIPHPKDPERDRVVLSKGHAALALYSVFFLRGLIDEETLQTYCQDASSLGVHPEYGLAGVDFGTGSLGQGLSFAVGAALAAKMQKSSRRIFVVISDAECNEGSIWEAAMFAAHHKLSNLVLLVDDNKQQAFGYTKDVLALNPLVDRWRSFGWDSVEVDGHNLEALMETIEGFDNSVGARPHVILAQTICGKGVSFMEGTIEWHYLSLNENQYQQSLREIELQA